MIDLNKPRLTEKYGGSFGLVKVKDDEQEVESPYPNTLKAILECFNRLGELENAIEDGELAPVVRGEWIEHEDEMECPQCGYFWNYCDNDTERFNCCPNCGAKMEDKP